MIKKFFLLCLTLAGLAVWGSAPARPSLNSIDQKLDQLSSGQQDIRADIEALRSILFANVATCEDIEYSGVMWGRQVRGVDLRSYTNSTLHFIGCFAGIGSQCLPEEFFCSFDRGALTLTFGAPSGSVRALLDPGDAAGASMTGGVFDCASGSNPDALHNAPDKQADANALCRALGYAGGTVDAVNTNNCPEPTAVDPDGGNWTSDFVRSDGYGQSFTCSGAQ